VLDTLKQKEISQGGLMKNGNAKNAESLIGKIGLQVLAIVSLFLASGCAAPRVAIHQTWFDEPSHRIAVLPLTSEGMSGSDISDALVTELMGSGFSIMERTDLEKVLQEQKLHYTGAIDPQTAIQAGQLAGVDFIVVGSVTKRAGRSAQIAQVNVRWVNVRTGQVMASVSLKNGLGGTAEAIAVKISRALGYAADPSSSYAAANPYAYRGRTDSF
jgi:curli biogenesis system outer membrane secretion channel CsgG